MHHRLPTSLPILVALGLMACSQASPPEATAPTPEPQAPAAPAPAPAAAADADVDVARGIAARFLGELKPALVGAMQAGGPTHAIPVCAERSPEIAASLSKETGWTVTRVSLKARAPSATPDAWERAGLERFDAEVASGTPANTLEHAEVITAETGNSFRYLKAIPTGAVCLSCHGESISQDVRDTLAVHYPGDAATGYALGQVRGAFSLSKTLP